MILKALLIAMTSAAISFFISHSQLLERFRSRLSEYGSIQKPLRSRGGSIAFFFHELVSCCYCLGHWVSVVLMILVPVTLFDIFRPLNFLLTWLVISWVAGILSMATSRLWSE